MESPHFYGHSATGLFPHYGAIFMANTSTRKECFQRKIFGLPTALANFVMNIKTGMILFLFDYQERKLYGVFEACSDGRMNIVSSAYKSSGKQFPAQVQFRIIWRCFPIPEIVFHDAIKENYYAPYKFHFGLSKHQVRKLLFLFETRAKCTRAVGRTIVNREVCESSMEVRSLNLPHDPANPGHELSIVQPSDPANPETQRATAPDASSLPSKDYSETVPEKSVVLDASQDVVASEPEDFIPLPPLEPEEWDFDFFADCDLDARMLDGIFDPSPICFPVGEGETLEEGEKLEEGKCFLKCDSHPLGSPSSEEQKDHDIHHTREYQVKGGLYSDNAEARRSVFSRLEASTSVISGNVKKMTGVFSGRTELMTSNLSCNLNSKAGVSSRLSYPATAAFQKNQHDTHGGTTIQLMKMLEESHKKWEKERNKRKHETGLRYNGVRTHGKRINVFSRLSRGYMMETEGTQKESASVMKNLNTLQGEFGQAPSQDGNNECDYDGAQRTVALETEEEVKSIGVLAGREVFPPEGDQKRRRLDREFSGIRSLHLKARIRDGESSSVQVPSEESSDGLGTTGSCEGCNRVDGIGSVFF
ncbi:hypothetical protein Dimus_011124 [Dionaea muscipula]